ncbi:MAG: DNA repair protein RecN [Pseudomonadota bacterium]|nr:DNA repair protein RecN [Pseudomonadota bacterium]
MLAQLSIRNFAIIESLDISFSKGMNILTGETGAGKSIIMGAVSLLLGDRASVDMIRSSADTATVEARFLLSDQDGIRSRLAEWGLEAEDEMVARRIISRGGKNRVYINGNLVSLAMLAELGESLLNICGQHEHQLLLKEDHHLDILDAFGGLQGLRGDYEVLYDRLQALKERRRTLEIRQRQREEREEFLRFQHAEIEAAAPEAGEDVRLAEEKRILTNTRKLTDHAVMAHEILYGRERSLLEELRTVRNAVGEIKKIDTRLKVAETQLDDIYYCLEDAAHTLRDYAQGLAGDDKRLEQIDERIDLLNKLKRKHGGALTEVLKKKEALERELDGIASLGRDLEETELSLQAVLRELEAKAGELSAARRVVAGRLREAVEEEIHALRMEAAVFSVVFREDDEGDDAYTPRGADRLEFHLSANPGEAPKPLSRVASGGELSRLVLAMKNVLARAGSVGTMVFDEVDSGIGGATAEIVGKKIRAAAERHQVLCITHLPQIACYGDRHFLVTKHVGEERTETQVRELGAEARVEEIARMLSGLEITETTKSHAREMLARAGRRERC